MTNRLSRARLHIKAVIPPGDWLLGALPFNTFRVESCKLEANDNMQLLANGITIPFDGQVHDLRVDPSERSRAPSGVLCVGAHLSLFLRNNGESPEPVDIQVAGTTVDGPPQEEGTKVLPELGCKVVLGIVAQEVVRELHSPGAIDPEELVRITREHVEDSERAVTLAFEAACLSGDKHDHDEYERALEQLNRQQNLAFSAAQNLEARRRARAAAAATGLTLEST